MKDWSGLKFKVAEKCGEKMDFVFLEYDQERTHKVTFFKHEEFDGVGAMTRFYENYDEDLHQPQLKLPMNPGPIKKVGYLLKYLRETRSVDIRWKTKTDCTGFGENLFVIHFDKPQTESITGHCSLHKISLTSFLLSHLDKVVCAHLLKPGSQRKWISPINMRGGVVQEKVYGNFSSSIILNFHEDLGPNEIHQRIKEYLQHNIHYGGWIYSNMVKWIGEAGTTYMVRRLKDIGTGVFSNLGAWESPQKFSPEHTLAVGAPTSRILPVACAAIIWNGELNLSMHLHPCLELDPEEAEDVMQSWAGAIGKEVEMFSLGALKNWPMEDLYQTAEWVRLGE